MSSTNIINFSLRQNKSIERAVTFDCLARVVRHIKLSDMVYVGFGSVWFADFALAHRLLGVDTMISIEHEPIIYKRAGFNKPYRTLEVVEGESGTVIPELLQREDLINRPWIVWLDYDNDIDRDKLDELVELTRTLPNDSMLLVTYSSQAGKYGRNEYRPEYLSQLFGDSAPEGITVSDTRQQDDLSRILAKSTEQFLVSTAIQSGRIGPLVPAIRLLYRDSAPMVTVGVILPAPENENAIRDLISDADWLGRSDKLIQAPHLTPKEVIALQGRLPSKVPITRDDVVAMGFDLDEGQLDSFVEHYLRYPQFAQIAH